MAIHKCYTCGKEFEPTKTQLATWYRNGKQRIYCSVECGRKYIGKVSSPRMARTNRKYASERMKRKNPMRNPKVRAKVKTSLRAMGWRPQVRGGNGKPLPVAQQMLACALGWETEVIVPTRIKRDDNPMHYPTSYKVDIANEQLMIAIEVDGSSHCALKRQEQDRKKETFLRSSGWAVLRFSNKDVIERLSECVQTVLSTISK